MLNNSPDLISQPFGIGIVVIVPMGDKITARFTTARIPGFTHCRPSRQLQITDSFIARYQMPDVRAACHDQEFPIRVRLILPALDRLG
jgi:hypothetical protein